MLLFPSDEKKIVKDQKVIRKKISCYIKSPKRFRLSCTGDSTLVILGFVSSKTDLISPHFFLQGTGVNVYAYTEVAKLSITSVARGKP